MDNELVAAVEHFVGQVPDVQPEYGQSHQDHRRGRYQRLPHERPLRQRGKQHHSGDTEPEDREDRLGEVSHRRRNSAHTRGHDRLGKLRKPGINATATGGRSTFPDRPRCDRPATD
ncbi:hypothetical protein [Lysobacter gummosus]|uniref:hypothetical protein n=1 Tax=Lysobacter gummosus TaxID=262324 RepID=UPI003645E2A4